MPDRPPASLGELLDRVRKASGRDAVTVADIVDAVGRHSLLPLMIVPAALAATPLSGIPGLTAVCGLAIALIAGQMLLSYDTVRLPGFVTRRQVEGARLRKVLDWARPVTDWVDRHTGGRMTWLFHRPFVYLPETLCLLTGLAMPALEVVPFSGSVAAAGVLLLALSLLTKDGLLFGIALLPYGALGWLVGAQLLG